MEKVFERCWTTGCGALKARLHNSITSIVVHRIEVSQEDPSYADDAEGIARFFRAHPVGVKATGGAMPYPLLIDSLGGVTQTVPLSRTTPHARTHNPTSIGVGVIGDFRIRAPSVAQRLTLVAVAVELLRDFGLTEAALVGHDELAGGSADPDKICPGNGLSLKDLRRDVSQALELPAERFRFIW